MKSARQHIALPEWIHRRDRSPAPWTVLAGPMQRGEAYTDIARCTMRIPVGSDETSRCVRAHELMHAKVSPVVLWRPDDLAHIDDDVLVSAEEFRVNQLVKAAGFSIEQHLADGSETRSGERIGSNDDWNSAVLMLLATSGSKASRAFLTGVRRTQPDWVAPLREIDRQLKAMWKRAGAYGLESLASTTPWGEATAGWRFTLDIAQYVHGVLKAAPRGRPQVEGHEGAASGVRGSFARPIVVDLPLIHATARSLRPTRVASSSGRRPRHLDRILTDPDRRVFDRRIRTAGGVILVDQSGSMRLTDDDVWDMIRSAPGCTVIGYSHEARSTSTPNIWILARQGRIVRTVPRGNGGNGVDGPALRFAATFRRRPDPFIWVCDGYVTDAFDDHCDALTRECAHLVAAHRIHQVPDIEAAKAALARASRGCALATRAIGPVEAARRAA